MLSVFVLLTLLLGVINGVNFTMAAQDADEITQMLILGRGQFGFQPEGESAPKGGAAGEAPFGPGGFEGLGPRSPELAASVRYFTVEFSASGQGRLTAYAISAVSQQEALSWAESLLLKQPTGWTRTVYRYRVYTEAGRTLVTVIDQGRELLPSYRILIISVTGELLGLLICLPVLAFAAKKILEPLREADRRQKRFIAEVEQKFRVPLTVINANTECMERENGASEYTGSINRQVKKMTALVKDLGALALFHNPDVSAQIDLSDILHCALDAAERDFAAAGIAVTSDIAPGVTVTADDEELRRVCAELAENAVKFAKTRAAFVLRQQNGRVTLLAENDTDLPDGSASLALDRFTRLPNAEGKPGAGLGLAKVKEAVQSFGGRIAAAVSGGTFTVRISM